jgi:hypothetical protein
MFRMLILKIRNGSGPVNQGFGTFGFCYQIVNKPDSVMQGLSWKMIVA